MFEEPIIEADWVIENLLPVGAHIVAGAPKIGKSWMVLAMGLAVSMGSPSGTTPCVREQYSIFVLRTPMRE